MSNTDNSDYPSQPQPQKPKRGRPKSTNPNTQKRNSNFYADRGQVRYSLIISQEHKQRLLEISETYGITQGEAIEVMLDKLNQNVLDAFKLKSASDTIEKDKKVAELLKKLTPEQIEQLLAGSK